jgi:replication fork clamp-binding protein CrfC
LFIQKLSVVEYAVFAHNPGKQYYDFDQVRDEIVNQTERETGTGVCVTDKPINLKIYSPNVVNLTLIDLPGITRNPVGDQPRNIEEILRNMVVRYIREPSCIIMAVTAANTDLALSDAIQLAKEYDPTGERTIGVITKVDIMDRGTDASEIFDGRVIPLKLGYVGVINRSQNDINQRKDMHRQWEDERRFFQTYYPDRCQQMGTEFLRNRLNELLVSHISSTLPDIIAKVTSYRQKIRYHSRGNFT